MIDLPRDYDGPPGKENHGTTIAFRISADLVKRLRSLAFKTRSSLFILLLTAFKVLLSRYSGQEDIVVGSPFTGRTQPDTHDLIGYFTNIVALRTDLSGNPNISSLIERVRETVLEAYTNQDYTFDQLLANHNLKRKAGGTPLFNVMFLFRNVSLAGTELPGVNIEVIEFDCKRHKFDLTLQVSDATEELRCKLIFNDDLFNKPRMERMVEHFQALVRGIGEGIQGRLSDLGMLSKEEMSTLLEAFNTPPPLVPEMNFSGSSGGVESAGPLARHRVYVLDAWLNLVPVGVPGDVYLGGPGFACSCLNPPVQSADRFVADPYCIEPGSRMYRIGSRARWRTDGSLEFPRLEVPALALDQVALTDIDGAPRSPLEAAVARIWAEILRVPRVGIHDSFFELGGHSLTVLRLFTRVRETFGAGLTMRAIFEAPRLGEFVSAVESKCRSLGAWGHAHGVMDQSSQKMGFHAASIEPTDHTGPVPLSWAQESIWILDQIMPGQPFNNISAGFQVVGPLDLLALDQGLNAMVRRHESLRTTFVAIDGTPYQVISPELRLALNVVDLSWLPLVQRDSQVKHLAMEEARRPFDLSRGPLARVSVLRLDQGNHVVLLTVHHIIFDLWSLNVAAGELAVLYQAARGGHLSSLPDPPIQYADFVVWQRAQIECISWKARLEDCKRRLSGVPALELPTDRPRPPMRSSRGALKPFVLSPELSQGVRALSRREGVTPFMTLLAAFQIVLGRWSGQDDFAVGSPVANRTKPETEPLIGYFINMLALRADLSGNPTVREHLARVREVALDAFEHQEMPLEVLIRSLNPQNDVSRSLMFQVMFVLQNISLPTLGPLDLTITPFNSNEGNGTAKFDLSLGFDDTPDRFVGRIEFNTDLFDVATIDRMVKHFQVVLRGMLTNPDQRLSRLPILTEDECQRILVEWNATHRDWPGEASIPQCFEAQVVRSPEAIALIAQDQVMTYGELNARANQLARSLKRRGIGPDVPVGICTGRVVEMAVAILGTLKAGGACVPLDSTYPHERLAYIAKDSGAALLLTLEPLLPTLFYHSGDVICLDTDWEAIACESKENLAGVPEPEQGAYVIYTSGSTGLAKGVVLTHRGLVNHALAAIDLYGLTPSDRVLQFNSLSFDISVEELLPSWCAGATVVLRPENAVLAKQSFGNWLKSERISVVDLPTAFWQEWVRELVARRESPPATLRIVIVGGEKATGRAYNSWLEAGGGKIRWVNTYGPTETSVIATAYEPAVGSGPQGNNADPPIGRPIANVQIYILDRSFQPVPIGVPGEIFIGGDGLARGYLNHPELTEERFVPDPFSHHPGKRLYRTGDRARWHGDGTIEFLGRYDDQVKIRGFRVDPGEVEAALATHPGVAQSAVVVRDDDRRGQQLVGYVIPAFGTMPDAAELRRHLTTLLPEYLMPAAFIVLESMPLTPSGKIDRRTLPCPASRPEGYRAPRTLEEEILCRLFTDLLVQDRVSIDDDFFELGGHSLLVLRLCNEIAITFKQNHPLNLIYRHRTVEQIAAVLRQSAPADPGASLPLAIARADNRKAPFFCLSNGPLFASHLGDQPVHALGIIYDDLLAYSSIEELAVVNLERLREYQKEGPYQLSGYCGLAMVAFEMARRLHQQGQEVSLLVMIDPPPILDPALRSSRLRFYLGHLVYHLSRIVKFHPKLWLRYCFTKASILKRRIFARSMEIANRPEKVDRLSRMEKTIRAYTPEIYPGPVTILVSKERIEDSAGNTDFGWRRVSTGGFEVRVVPGLHSTIMEENNFPILAKEVKDLLGRNTKVDCH